MYLSRYLTNFRKVQWLESTLEGLMPKECLHLSLRSS